MRLGRDGVVGLIGLSISLLLLPQAFGLPRLPIVPIGPGFYPTLVLVFMALVSAILLLQDIVAQRRAGAAVADEARRRRGVPTIWWPRPSRSSPPISCFCRCSDSASPRRRSSPFSRRCWSGRRRSRQWAMLAAVAIGTSIVTYIVFERYLLVLLPRGAWTGW